MPMKLRLHSGRETFDHSLELKPKQDNDAAGGAFELLLDGSQARHADCVQIASGTYSILLDGRSYEARVTTGPAGSGSGTYTVVVGSDEYRVEVEDPRARGHQGKPGESAGPQEILAPMPGRVVKLLVEENQKVEAG